MATALADLVLRRHVALQRLSAAELQKVDDFIDQIAAELARRLSGQELTQLARSRVERTIERLNQYLGETLGAYRQDIMKDLLVIADDQAQATLTTLKSLDVSTDFNAPTALQIRAAALESPLLVQGPDGGKLLKGFLKGWTDTETARVTNAIRLGYATGQTNAQIVQGIRGTAALKYNDGLLAVTKRNADTIVHTAIQHVANQARQAVFDANDDIVESVRWIATLDNRTCFIAGTLVETPTGSKPIESLRIGDWVMGGSLKPRQVTATNSSLSKNLVRVKLSNGQSVICTADHQWLTERGWVEAGELVASERLAKRL